MNIDFATISVDREPDSLFVGQQEELLWRIEPAEIDAFAKLSGDHNPLHMEHDFAIAAGFRCRVVHGFLLGAKVSALVGMLLPGRRCLILEQSLAYPKAIYPGELIRITATISELHPDQNLLKVSIRAIRQDEAGTAERKDLVARGHVLCRNR